MPRFLLVSLAVALALSTARPTAAQLADSTTVTDSLKAALQQFERAQPPTAADSAQLRRWADSVQAKGESLLGQNPSAARGSLQQVLYAARALQDSLRIARASLNTGVSFEMQSQFKEALERYREALRISRKLELERRVAEILLSIGITHAKQGRYKEALSRYRESLQINRDLGIQRNVALLLNNIGITYENQGQYKEALIRYRKSLQIKRDLGDREGIARTLNNIGVIHKMEGRYEKALSSYRESLEIKRKIDDRTGVASTLNNIGLVHKSQGHYEEALSRLQESLEINQELGARRRVANTLNNIGLVYRAQGRYDEALSHHQEALAINVEIGAQPQEILNLKNIGKVTLQQGRLAEATDTLGRAVRLAEQLRQNTTSPEARRSLLSTQIEGYQALTTVHVRSGHPDSALHSLEQARARLLADRLAGTATGDTSFALPSVAELRRTLGPEEAALLYANVESEWPLTALLISRDTTLARELPDSTVRAEIEDAYPTRLNQLRQEDDPLTEALGAEASSPGTDADLPPLTEVIRLYRYYLTREQAAPSIQNDLSRRLHGLLVEPIAEALKDKSDLVVVPTGALGYLPVETLQDESGQYLAQKKHVRYAQSLTVLRQLQQRDYGERARSLLTIGGAAYASDKMMESGSVIAETGDGTTQVATDEFASTLLRGVERQIEQGISPKSAYQQLGYRTWADLPGTEQEAQTLGRLLGETSTVITGPDASEDTIRALSENDQLSEHRYVHFATHGVTVPEVPKLSALVLSQVGASDSLAARDGYLTMEEIADLKMKADVAVLSACQTGLGKVVAGEGVVSLSHAFLRAGANATLVSQWKVLDASTQQFMTAVYRRAKAEGTSFAEAVTETKRAFINGEYGEKNTDPLRWAPFVYYGRE